MTPPFPLSPAPAWYTHPRWKDADTHRNGVFEVGDTVTIRLNDAGADAYEIRDFFGSLMDSGAVSGDELELGNDWDPGWYRVYFTGTQTDSVFGDAYASANFTVMRANPNFPDMPPGNHTGTAYGDPLDRGFDPIMRGVMGCGNGRMELPPPSTPNFGDLVNPDPATTWLGKVGLEAEFGQEWWLVPGEADPARPRTNWLSWSQGAVDRATLPATGSSSVYIYVYLLEDGVLDGADVFVSLEAGTSSGRKVTIYYPDAVTAVETYDNLADADAAADAINAASTRVFATASGAGGTGTTMPATAIGNVNRLGVIGSVQYLYARGVTHFEGPYNEPGMGTAAAAADTTHQMKLLSAYIHAGEPNAIAMGPSAVDINDLGRWRLLMEAGFADHVDVISTHDYNSMSGGNLALGRYSIERFVQFLEYYGAAEKLGYLTEANSVPVAVYGVYHPRRSRFNLLNTLLWEQNGVPMERNVTWFDQSHGYWAIPAFLEFEDGSLNPQPAMFRTLCEETWGKPFDHMLRFGELGDKFILGSVYRGEDGSQTIAMMSTSFMEDLTVTLQVVGASSLTVVDPFGKTNTVTVTGGFADITLYGVPQYVRLPVGVNAAVYQINDWGPSPPPSISGKAVDMTVGSSFTMVPADSSLNTLYSEGRGIYYSSAGLPENATMLWDGTVEVDRVIVVCGQVWQNASTLVEFSVQTTTDGSNFTTRQTVTKSTPSSFLFGNDSAGTGCSQETYWDEQWVFDVPLGATYSVTGIRIVATTASYGGEPDAAAVAAGGQGNATPHLVLQEIYVPSDSLADVPVATPKTADFELGTNGATISSGDTGDLTTWDSVAGSPTYDNSQAARGIQSMKLSAGATENTNWDLDDLTDHYGRFFFRQGPTTSGFPRIVYFYDTGNVEAAAIQVNADGNRLRINDADGTEMNGITGLDQGRWYRVEYHIVHSETEGQIHIRVYDDTTGELRETLISPPDWNTATKAASISFGAPISGGVQQHWMDVIAADADAYLGPVAPTVDPDDELVGVVMI